MHGSWILLMLLERTLTPCCVGLRGGDCVAFRTGRGLDRHASVCLLAGGVSGALLVRRVCYGGGGTVVGAGCVVFCCAP